MGKEKWIVPINPDLKPLVNAYIKNKGMNKSGFVELAIREKLNKAS